MNKYITICILLIFNLNCNSQISVDSLISILNARYTKTGTRNHMQEKFTVFETEDKKDRYDLYLDSAGHLNEFIGLSIVHYSYDDQNRIILIEGFNSKGERSYWDFPDVQKFRYVNDTLIPAMSQISNQICDCDNPDNLYHVTIVQEINSGSNYNPVRYSVFSKDSLMKLSFSTNSVGEIWPSLMNVAYIFRVFDPVNKSLILQERYYNPKLKLVMGLHSIYTSETIAYTASESYAYSIRTFDKGSLKTASFYNKKGKLIKTQQYGDIRGPSAN